MRLVLLVCSCLCLCLGVPTAATVVVESLDSIFGFNKPLVDANCPFHPVPVPLPASLPAAIRSAIDGVEDQLKKQIDDKNLPGIAYSVVYRDSVLKSRGLGVLNRTAKPAKPPDGSTIFRIGSVSKVFATLVLYQLYDQGKVSSLDEPLVKFCPQFSIKDTFQEHYDITLRQLAAQMSGLPREAPCTPTATNTCPQNTTQILEALKEEYLLFRPWTVPSYSNLAYGLLGHCLVEHLFPGMTYEEYVMKNIIQPLNLTNTGFNITDSVKSRMAVGYLPGGIEAPLTDIGWIGPAGQMYSTADDLNKFAQFFYAGVAEDATVADKVLSPTLRKEMLLQVFVNRDQLTGFGTPWEIRFQANYTVLRKGGNVFGYSCLFSFIPELQLGLNVMFSGQANEFSVSNNAYSLLIPAFVFALKPLQKPYSYPSSPKVYEGTYNLSVPGQPAVEIATRDNQLFMNFVGVFTTYLAYVNEQFLQIAFPDSLEPCLSRELAALRHQAVLFEPAGPSGTSPGFTVPGWVPSVKFTRVK